MIEKVLFQLGVTASNAQSHGIILLGFGIVWLILAFTTSRRRFSIISLLFYLIMGMLFIITGLGCFYLAFYYAFMFTRVVIIGLAIFAVVIAVVIMGIGFAIRESQKTKRRRIDRVEDMTGIEENKKNENIDGFE